MKHLYHIGIVLLFMLLTGCEKSIVEEEAGGSKTTTEGINTEAKQGALTIAEAQQAANGTSICVKGYIVGATQKSMGNMCLEAPFEGSTAIILADQRLDMNETTEGKLFPVCLTDASKGIREAYNLQDNAQYHNCFVYINGTKETYLSLDGLKKVKAIEIDPNHVDDTATDTGNNPPSDDETTENPDSNGEDDADDNGTSDDDNSGTNDGDNSEEPTDDPQPTDNVLTVAQAKSQKEGTEITIQGYIVAAVSGGKDYISFDYPNFDGNNTAIVLADTKYEAGTTFDTTGYTDLYIIYLGDSSKKYKDELCLPKHPDNQNRLVRITGRVGFYYGMKLLIEVEDYEWVTP